MMTYVHKELLALRLLLLLVLLVCITINYGNSKSYKNRKTTKRSNKDPYRKQMCVPMDQTVRAQHKSCLLRPDTGPCRADILMWYYDAKQGTCYRYFWGGCQGNGNKYNTFQECMNYCYLNTSMATAHVPYFCSLAFDYGTCFGQYNRWGWDSLLKSCRRRLYSGCGGNQNNFETKHECLATCLIKPNNTMNSFNLYTTCIPFTIADLQ